MGVVNVCVVIAGLLVSTLVTGGGVVFNSEDIFGGVVTERVVTARLFVKA